MTETTADKEKSSFKEQTIKPVEEVDDNFGGFLLGFKVIPDEKMRPRSFRIEKTDKIDEEINLINEELSDDSCGDASELKQDKGKRKKKGCCGMFRNSEEDDFNFN